MTRGKDGWLEAGLEILGREGHEALTIERLCQTTGKTKGSFYHHFASAGEFARQVMSHWQRTHTQDLIDLTSPTDPEQGLAQLRSLAGRLPTEREAAFRSWAARDPEAARVLAEVDQARVAHLAALHRGRGATDDHALTLAWLEYALSLGLAQLGSTFPRERRRLALDLFEKGLKG